MDQALDNSIGVVTELEKLCCKLKGMLGTDVKNALASAVTDAQQQQSESHQKLLEEKSKLEVENGQLRVAMGNLCGNSGEASELKVKLQEEKVQHDKCKQEVVRLNEAIDIATKYRKHAQRLEKEKLDLSTQVEKLERSCNELEMKFKQQEEQKGLPGYHRNLNDNFDNVDTEVSRLTRENDKLKGKCDRYKDRCRLLRNQCKTLERQSRAQYSEPVQRGTMCDQAVQTEAQIGVPTQVLDAVQIDQDLLAKSKEHASQWGDLQIQNNFEPNSVKSVGAFDGDDHETPVTESRKRRRVDDNPESLNDQPGSSEPLHDNMEGDDIENCMETGKASGNMCDFETPQKSSPRTVQVVLAAVHSGGALLNEGLDPDPTLPCTPTTTMQDLTQQPSQNPPSSGVKKESPPIAKIHRSVPQSLKKTNRGGGNQEWVVRQGDLSEGRWEERRVEGDCDFLASPGLLVGAGNRPVQIDAQENLMSSDAGQGNPQEGGYKYTEVVRKRADREALPAFDCPDCRNFYEALKTWGAVPAGKPMCGHSVDPGRDVSTPKRLVQNASRHRAKFPPPRTPEGFWSLGFPDSMDPAQ